MQKPWKFPEPLHWRDGRFLSEGVWEAGSVTGSLFLTKSPGFPEKHPHLWHKSFVLLHLASGQLAARSLRCRLIPENQVRSNVMIIRSTQCTRGCMCKFRSMMASLQSYFFLLKSEGGGLLISWSKWLLIFHCTLEAAASKCVAVDWAALVFRVADFGKLLQTSGFKGRGTGAATTDWLQRHSSSTWVSFEQQKINFKKCLHFCRADIPPINWISKAFCQSDLVLGII